MGKKLIGQSERTLICTPLTGETKEGIISQLVEDLQKQPDIIEWRADYFRHASDTDQVLDVIEAIRKETGDMTMIFTLRSAREGGHPGSLTDQHAIFLNAEVCRKTAVEYVDCELGYGEDNIRYLREVARQNGKMIIGSYHDFTKTPGRDVILSKLAAAEKLGLDVAKVAVMPQSLEDVLTLLGTTLEAKGLARIPLITVSMGQFGVISRIAGGLFGSSVSFAQGAAGSAPGQLPIDDLRTVLDIMNRTRGLSQGFLSNYEKTAIPKDAS